MPTRCNRGFIADLIACSACFGHHYAHHQELKSIIQWLLPVVFRAVVFKLLVWCGAEGYVSGLQDAADQQLENNSTKYHRQQPLYNTLELLMVGIVVPETCWASNKICNKNLCCIYLAFYFHILTTMHGQNHVKVNMQYTCIWYTPHSTLWTPNTHTYNHHGCLNRKLNDSYSQNVCRATPMPYFPFNDTCASITRNFHRVLHATSIGTK